MHDSSTNTVSRLKGSYNLFSPCRTSYNRTLFQVLFPDIQEGDRTDVRAVFNEILSNPDDATDPDCTGSDMLDQILVAKTDVDNQCPGVNGKVPLGYMGAGDTANPYIIPCPPVYTHLDMFSISCDSPGDTVSYKMLPLAGFFLVEYM